MACYVRFSVVAMCSSGQQVVLVGDQPCLGSWDVAKGVCMETTAATFPTWTSALEIPENTAIEYKYVIIDSDRNSPPPSPTAARRDQSLYIHWEDVPFVNRKRQIGNHGTEMTIDDGVFGMDNSRYTKFLICLKGSMRTDAGTAQHFSLSTAAIQSFGLGDVSSGAIACASTLVLASTRGSKNLMNMSEFSNLIEQLHNKDAMCRALNTVDSFLRHTRGVDTSTLYSEIRPWELSAWVQSARSHWDRTGKVCILRSIEAGESSPLSYSERAQDIHSQHRKFLEEELPFRTGAPFFLQADSGACVALERWASVFDWRAKYDHLHLMMCGGYNIPWVLCIPTIMEASGGALDAGEVLFLVTFREEAPFPQQHAHEVQAVSQALFEI